MSRRERDKGRVGEREVAAIYERHGFAVRGLEGAGDHLIAVSPRLGLVIHSEVKRQETARPWAWWEQAAAEAPPGTFPVVHFRRNRSRWLAIVDAERLVDLLAALGKHPEPPSPLGGPSPILPPLREIDSPDPLD